MTIPNPFQAEPEIAIPNGTKWINNSIQNYVDFVESYYSSPRQYDNKTPSDLVHPGWLMGDSLSVQALLSAASRLDSIIVWEFMLAAGTNIPHQFLAKWLVTSLNSKALLKFLCTKFTTIINRIPFRRLFVLFANKASTLEIFQLGQGLFPKLKDSSSLNRQCIKTTYSQFLHADRQYLDEISQDLGTIHIGDGINPDDDHEDVYLTFPIVHAINSPIIFEFLVQHEKIQLDGLYLYLTLILNKDARGDIARAKKIPRMPSPHVKMDELLKGMMTPWDAKYENTRWLLSFWEQTLVQHLNKMTLWKYQSYINSILTHYIGAFSPEMTTILIDYLRNGWFPTLLMYPKDHPMYTIPIDHPSLQSINIDHNSDGDKEPQPQSIFEILQSASQFLSPRSGLASIFELLFGTNPSFIRVALEARFQGYTLLQQAVYYGDQSVVETLLKNGAQFDHNFWQPDSSTLVPKIDYFSFNSILGYSCSQHLQYPDPNQLSSRLSFLGWFLDQPGAEIGLIHNSHRLTWSFKINSPDVDQSHSIPGLPKHTALLTKPVSPILLTVAFNLASPRRYDTSLIQRLIKLSRNHNPHGIAPFSYLDEKILFHDLLKLPPYSTLVHTYHLPPQTPIELDHFLSLVHVPIVMGDYGLVLEDLIECIINDISSLEWE